MKVLPIVEVRAMTPEELTAMAKQGYSLEKSSNKATEAYKTSYPAMGILVCVAEERLNLLKSELDEKGQPKKRQISANTSLAEYWKSSVVCNKEAKLNSHYLSCAVAFGTYVRCDLITEAEYALNTSEALETGASISTAVGHDVTHEAVLAAATELKLRGKDSRKTLAAILARVKESKPLTEERVREMLAVIMAGGYLTTVIGAVGGEVAYVTEEDVASVAYVGLLTALEMFDQNVTKEKDAEGKPARRFSEKAIDSWVAADVAAKKDATAAQNGVQQLAAGKPVVQPAPAAPAPAPAVKPAKVLAAA